MPSFLFNAEHTLLWANSEAASIRSHENLHHRFLSAMEQPDLLFFVIVFKTIEIIPHCFPRANCFRTFCEKIAAVGQLHNGDVYKRQVVEHACDQLHIARLGRFILNDRSQRKQLVHAQLRLRELIRKLVVNLQRLIQYLAGNLIGVGIDKEIVGCLLYTSRCV